MDVRCNEIKRCVIRSVPQKNGGGQILGPRVKLLCGTQAEA